MVTHLLGLARARCPTGGDGVTAHVALRRDDPHPVTVAPVADGRLTGTP